MKTVSVIIPAYNSQNTIIRCVCSVAQQSYTGIEEIIVVDDGSTDKTSERLNDILIKDNRVKYYKKKNGGVSAARNYGLDKAQGDYVMFLDSDDEIKPQLVEKMICFAGNAELVIAGIELHRDSGVSVIKKSGTYSVPEVIGNYGSSIPSLLINGPCAKLYKRDIIKNKKIEFRPDISLGEDTLFVFQYMQYCKKVTFADETGYIYYQLNENSLMNKFRKDGYENAKMVYGLLFETAGVICSGAIPVSLKKVYRNVLLMYIRKTIYNKKYVERKQIKNMILDYINDDIIYNYTKETAQTYDLQGIINYLTLKRKAGILEYLLRLHVRIRGI